MSFYLFFHNCSTNTKKVTVSNWATTGFRTLQDDPKLVWSIHAAKIQRTLEYKKAYEKSKGIHSIPPT